VSKIYDPAFTVSNQGNSGILKSCNVLNAAKTYFSCASLTGMYLENEGGTGS